MVLFAVAFVGAVATIRVAGGNLRALDDFSLRRGWLLASAVAVQGGLGVLADGPAARLLHVASLVCVTGVIMINLDRRGMEIAAVGALTNLAAIVANFGVMPASPRAWAASEGPILGDGFANARPLPHGSLAFLGDWIPVPTWFPGAAPLSIGDLLLATGLVVLIHAATGARWLTRSTPPNSLNVA